MLASRQDFFLRLTKGLAEATAFILDGNNKTEVTRTLMKNLRLTRAEESESSYKVLRLMSTSTWRLILRRIGLCNALSPG